MSELDSQRLGEFPHNRRALNLRRWLREKKEAEQEK
jgi:hypothetical protein